MIAQKYQLTLSKIRPYLFCNAESLPSFNLSPLGIQIDKELIFDCTKISSNSFFNLIMKMDELSFANQDMGMDRWVLYDCAAMPGAIFGFCIHINDLPEEYKGLWSEFKDLAYIPISMFVAIPMAQKDHWFAHNLCSLNSLLGSSLPGLGVLTKIYGLKTLNIKNQYGATQWNSEAMFIHTKLSQLKLISSYTPNHTHFETLTYLAQYDERSIEDILNVNSEPQGQKSYELECDDIEQMKALQVKIEQGEKLFVAGKPVLKNGKKIFSIYKK